MGIGGARAPCRDERVGMGKRATLADVAERAGMSVTAVSLVLNNREGSRLSTDAQERIRATARELDYRPNPAARSLRVGKTRTVGFISDDVTVTRYASAMIRGALDGAEARDHTVLMAEAGNDPKRINRAVRAMLDRRPDGLVFALMGSKEIDIPAEIGDLPVVVLNGASTGGHASVLRDEITAGRDVANHLIERGHERIALLGDADALRRDRRLSVSIGDRFTGIESAMAEADLTFMARHFEEDWEPEKGYRGMLALLDQGLDLTAIIAMNDRLAFGAYQAIWERGLRIPTDISIASFDDDVIATYVHPGLTTVRIPYEEMGRAAMDMLLTGKPVGHLQVPMPLRERESVADRQQ